MSSTAGAPAASRSFQAQDLAYVAVFAALIAALSLVPPIPVGSFGVPITLQTLAISLTALILGPWLGGAAVLLYLLVGTAGLPVFAGGKAGMSVWFGPTAGYLLSFLVNVVVVGLISRTYLRKGLVKLTWLWMLLTLLVCRLLVIYPLGTAGIARAAEKPFTAVAAVDLAYWPGDLLKSIVAVLVAVAVFKAFPRLLRR